MPKILLRLTEAQKVRWTELAWKDRKTLSAYIRDSVDIREVALAPTIQDIPHIAAETVAVAETEYVVPTAAELLASIPGLVPASKLSRAEKKLPVPPEGHSAKCVCKKCNEARGWRK